MADQPGKAKLPDPVTITLPDQTYRPRKVDADKEYDMPGASIKQVRRAFFRPEKVLWTARS